MLKRPKSLLAAVAVGAAAVLALTACAGGGNAAGGERVYVQAIGADPESLNPQLTNGASVTALAAPLLEPLVGLTGEFEVVPLLADSWEFSDDGLDFTLHLHEGVTWHDGEPFTADDVKFNFDEIMPLNTYGPAMTDKITETEVVDEHTVVVHMSEQYGPMLQTLSLMVLLPKHIYEGTDYITNPANGEPIGTGPLVFESFQSGRELVYVKNPDYWGGEVQVDRAVFPIMSDPNTRTLALINGEVDSAEVDPSQADQIGEIPELVHLESGFVPQSMVVEMNAQNEYLESPEVRAAVFAAIDRQQIADTAIGGGWGTPATGFLPDSLGWALSEDVNFDEDFPRDVDAINQSLDDAGFPEGADGTRFTLNLTYITELADTALAAEQLVSMLGEVGIGLNLQSLTSPVFTDQVYTQSDFDLALLRTTVSADPSLGVSRWYTCNPDKMAARNPSGICDPEIDEAAAGALSTIDETERGDYLKTMQERANELMFFAPLAWTTGGFPTVSTERWSGLEDRPKGSVVDFTQIEWVG
ncbi:MAG: ABC transporter substrate-binding protein [Pseudoclavibacter sp.]